MLNMQTTYDIDGRNTIVNLDRFIQQLLTTCVLVVLCTIPYASIAFPVSGIVFCGCQTSSIFMCWRHHENIG